MEKKEQKQIVNIVYARHLKGFQMQIDRIYNKDCVTGMKEMLENSVDLVVTSPPYDSLRDYQGYTFDFEATAKELYRITKPGGIIVWIVKDGTVKGGETGTSFRQALKFMEVGFTLHDTMIWLKDSFSFPNPNRYRDAFEYMFVLSKGKPKTFNLIADRPNKWAGSLVHGTSRERDGITYPKSNSGKTIVKDLGVRFNVWEQITEKNNSLGHPAVFPQKLAEDHIVSWSNPGDLVLDPFMGSGTTARACKKLGRRFIGFEISQEYCQMAEKTLSQEVLIGTN